jgi:F-type H+-transporting ATPase subunit b
MLRRLMPAKRIRLLALCLGLAFSARALAQEHAAEREDAAGKAASAAHDAAGTGGGAHSSSAQDVNPLKVQPTLALWSLLVFVGLFFILGKYAWKPLLEALHRREQHLEHVLLETERARNDSEGLLAEHRRLMAKAAEDVRNILEKGRHEAQAAADLIVKQAQGEAEAQRERASRDIASARDQALAEIWEKTADIAVSVAGRVLEKKLTGDDHRRLLEHAIESLPEVAKRNGHGRPVA